MIFKLEHALELSGGLFNQIGGLPPERESAGLGGAQESASLSFQWVMLLAASGSGAAL